MCLRITCTPAPCLSQHCSAAVSSSLGLVLYPCVSLPLPLPLCTSMPLPLSLLPLPLPLPLPVLLSLPLSLCVSASTFTSASAFASLCLSVTASASQPQPLGLGLGLCLCWLRVAVYDCASPSSKLLQQATHHAKASEAQSISAPEVSFVALLPSAETGR